MKRLLYMLMVALLLTGLIGVAAAEGDEDDTTPTTGTIQITCEYGDVALSGAEITIYKVADATIKHTSVNKDDKVTIVYSLIPEVSGFSVPDSAGYETFFAGMTAQKSIEIAAEWSELNLPAHDAKITDAEGKVTFEDVPLGIYLVSQTGRSGVSADYSLFGAYLVQIPFVTSTGDGLGVDMESLAYNLECRPKTTVEYIAPPPEDPPKTGDSFDGGYIIIAVAAGLVLIGCVVLNRKRKYN